MIEDNSMKRILNVFAIISLCFLTACSSKGLSDADPEAIYQEAYAAGYRDGFADGSKQTDQADQSVNKNVATASMARISISEESSGEEITYILNTNTKKIHKTTCPSVNQIAPQNYMETSRAYSELEDMNYSPCGNCHPDRDQ